MKNATPMGFGPSSLPFQFPWTAEPDNLSPTPPPQYHVPHYIPWNTPALCVLCSTVPWQLLAEWVLVLQLRGNGRCHVRNLHQSSCEKHVM